MGKAQAPCLGQEGNCGGEGPPAGQRVSRVERGRDKMHGFHNAAPVEEIAKTTENAVLRDEGTASFPPQ